MRRFVLLSASLILAGADYPDPPPALAPYIEGGSFDPGDYEWLRGNFPEAGEDEKAAYEAIAAWQERCLAEGHERLAEQLAAQGVTQPLAEHIPAGATPCLQSRYRYGIDRFANFAELAAANDRARPVFDALVRAIDLAERQTRSPPDDLAAQISHHTLADQMLRDALGWGSDDAGPQLDEGAAVVFRALVGARLTAEDAANTAWLKQVVAEHGWPTISLVGERASGDAWLLAQHADRDPAFQLRVLRLMEPLVAEGEVSSRNYAYLYDRVMLKLSGRQRFGTQVWCENGDYVPRPLDDAARLDELRAEMELESFAEYRKLFPETCQG